MTSMPDLSEVSKHMDISGRNDRIAQLRADFKSVFEAWRAHGRISADEFRAQVADAGNAIREKSSDVEWMDCAQKHFRQMAHQIEIDKARALDIAGEVRAMKKDVA